jgi:hyperosmotically inducible protein
MKRLIINTVVCALFSAAAAAQNSAPSESSEEAALSARVSKAVAQAASTDARDINVQTRDKTVQLSGFVKSERSRDAALKAAAAVPGVERVRNELAVEQGESESAPATATSDAAIAARVKTRLTEAGLPEGSDVQVDVQDGAVQLSGFVDSVESKTRAADLASTVAGVTDVQNNIAVQAERSR